MRCNPAPAPANAFIRTAGGAAVIRAAAGAQQVLGYECSRRGPRQAYYRPLRSQAEATFAQAVADGLGRPAPHKALSPRFFYDDRGSALFERICDAPEYYLTRAETAILAGAGDEIVRAAAAGAPPRPVRLVELGSGSSRKTRLLLDALAAVQDRTDYVPIDVSGMMPDSCGALAAEYDGLTITGVVDAYGGGLEFARRLGGGAANLVAFLGSSFGNFDAADGADFLALLRASMRPGDAFLAGLDLVKGRRALEAAYDDSQGITAEFNLNMLRRINSELDGDFDLSRFEHSARYNAAEQRVEMHIRSLERQRFEVARAGLAGVLGGGEMIHTENSHKYTLPQIRAMFGGAGLPVEGAWTDAGGAYALVLCRAAGPCRPAARPPPGAGAGADPSAPPSK